MPALTTEQPTERLPVVPERRSGRGWLFLFVGVFLIAGVYVGLRAVNALPSFLNPFDERTTVRASPVTVQAIRDMSRYVASEGDFQVLVDVQQGRDNIPGFLYGERTVLVAMGKVEAYVDFGQVADSDLTVNGDSVQLTLPAPTLGPPALDTEHSYVVAHESGVANWIAGVFTGAQPDQMALFHEAEQQISGAAQKSDLSETGQGQHHRHVDQAVQPARLPAGHHHLPRRSTVTPRSRAYRGESISKHHGLPLIVACFDGHGARVRRVRRTLPPPGPSTPSGVASSGAVAEPYRWVRRGRARSPLRFRRRRRRRRRTRRAWRWASAAADRSPGPRAALAIAPNTATPTALPIDRLNMLVAGHHAPLGPADGGLRRDQRRRGDQAQAGADDEAGDATTSTASCSPSSVSSRAGDARAAVPISAVARKPIRR